MMNFSDRSLQAYLQLAEQAVANGVFRFPTRPKIHVTWLAVVTSIENYTCEAVIPQAWMEIAFGQVDDRNLASRASALEALDSSTSCDPRNQCTFPPLFQNGGLDWHRQESLSCISYSIILDETQDACKRNQLPKKNPLCPRDSEKDASCQYGDQCHQEVLPEAPLFRRLF